MVELRMFLVLIIVVAVSGFYMEDGSGPITWDQFPEQVEEESEIPGTEVFMRIDPTDDFEWMKFKKIYNKTYDDPWEEGARRRNWEDNVRLVNQHNEDYLNGIYTYWTAIQEHSDMSEEEFLATMTGLILPEEGEEVYPPALEEEDISLPSTVDWSTRGYVTPVKNQGRCGSCWAFSAVGALEGQTKRKKGRLPDLSEQNLLDCANRKYGNWGCRGGWMNSAFRYVRDQGGIDGQSCYRYTARQSYCRYKARCKQSFDRGYRNVPKSESSLKRAIATQGPAAIAVDVSGRFGHYRGGVYNNPYCNSRRPNHAMLCVGYGRWRGVQYWKIKNSWGTRWGARGYVRMSRNRRNQCGIANFASYPSL